MDYDIAEDLSPSLSPPTSLPRWSVLTESLAHPPLATLPGTSSLLIGIALALALASYSPLGAAPYWPTSMWKSYSLVGRYYRDTPSLPWPPSLCSSSPLAIITGAPVPRSSYPLIGITGVTGFPL